MSHPSPPHTLRSASLGATSEMGADGPLKATSHLDLPADDDMDIIKPMRRKKELQRNPNVRSHVELADGTRLKNLFRLRKLLSDRTGENASKNVDLSEVELLCDLNLSPTLRRKTEMEERNRLDEKCMKELERNVADYVHLSGNFSPTFRRKIEMEERDLLEEEWIEELGSNDADYVHQAELEKIRLHYLRVKEKQMVQSNASDYAHPSGLAGAKFVQLPCSQSVKDLKECSKSDCQHSILKESGCSVHTHLHLPTFDASRLEPIEKFDGNRRLLRLENTQLGQSISVGVVIHSKDLEFCFFDSTDMAICVGVGLPQAKVFLHNDLSIIIEETSISDRENLDSWKSFLSENSSHLVMEAEWGVEGMGQDRQVETLGTRDGESLLWLCGVRLDGSSRYVDETYDAREVSWPLLYDMALITLAANTPQCNETTGESSAGGSTSLQGTIQSNLADKLNGKRNNVFSHGNFKDDGGSRDGDGDEDRFASNANALEDDDLPVVLKVTVHPLTKHEILNTQVKPYGLDRASIAPEIIFEFRKNHNCKRISIKTRTRLELASKMEVSHDVNMFGWYHTWIQISFGCEDTEGHSQNGRVALLRQNSCKILNTRTSYKYTVANAAVSSKANTYTNGGEVGLKVSNALLGGIALHGSLCGSNMQQVARSKGENIETTRDSVCRGFSFKDHSSTEFPACASFLIFYSLKGMNIWDNKEFLESEGLFSTIEPSIEGTWIPLNEHVTSPYLFKVSRSLIFHGRRIGHEDLISQYEQDYVLLFLVNHAMSHLRSQRNIHIELSPTNQQCIPDVLVVASAF